VHRNTLDDTCVVYQDIDLTNFLVDSLNEFSNLILVCNVTNVTLYILDTCFFVSCETTINEFLLDVVEDDCLDTCSSES